MVDEGRLAEIAKQAKVVLKENPKDVVEIKGIREEEIDKLVYHHLADYYVPGMDLVGKNRFILHVTNRGKNA